MKIKAVTVKVFELFTEDGSSLGLFRVESEWKGMQELRALDGHATVIIDSDVAPGAALEFFRDIFGHARAEFTIVKASPGLLPLDTAAQRKGAR